MHKVRFVTLVLLPLCLAFFLTPEFRQALKVLSTVHSDRWLREAQISPATLDQLRQEAESKRDARLLAFVAIRTGDAAERVRLSERVCQLDPQLTWIFWIPGKQYSAHGPAAAERLKKWDGDNAVAHLFEAEQIFERRQLARYAMNTVDNVQALENEQEWRAAMARAFAAPRYDAYTARRFELDRAVLREHGLADPVTVLATLASYPIGDLSAVRQYGRLVLKLGKDAETARNAAQALEHYWTVAHFGERMRLHGVTTIEKLTAESLQMDAYERLAPALRQSGRANEAGTLEFALQQLRDGHAARTGADPLSHSSNYEWTALIVQFFGMLVVIFGVVTLLTLAYSAGRHFFSAERSPLEVALLTIQNYAPFLLLLACGGLYISYYPYALNFNYYLTAGGQVHDLEPFFYNVLPMQGLQPGKLDIPLGTPFRPYIWYALIGVALVFVADRLLGRVLPGPTKPNAKAVSA